MSKYSKCDLVRTVKGTGNSVERNRGEFIVLNDDTWEVWKRNGASMTEFKQWYKSVSNAPIAKFIGSYPRYTFFEAF
jgi:hypothetical protein